jgi:transposase-like protein
MIGVQIKNGFIDFAKTDFKCPNCKKEYNDTDDKYLEKCERNKSGCAKIKCDCGKPFFMTYDCMGDAVSFL